MSSDFGHVESRSGAKKRAHSYFKRELENGG